MADVKIPTRGAFKPANSEMILNEAFTRFHANRQVKFDSCMSSLGGLMYITMIKTVPSWAAAFAVVLLSLHTTWPYFLSTYNHQKFLIWRDRLFVLHFFLHHAFSPWILDRIGVSFQPQVTSDNPLVFFLGFVGCSTVVWHCINCLMYRLKFRIFCIIQPIVLLSCLPHEFKHCRWAAQAPIASTVFRNLVAFGDSTVGSLFPGYNYVANSTMDEEMSLYKTCVTYHTWQLFFFGFIVPAFVIWRLERQVRLEFLLRDPWELLWPGGPTAGQMSAALTEGQLEQIQFNEMHGNDRRIFGVVLLAGAALWLCLRSLIL